MKEIFLGGDVSKGYIDVLILDCTGSVISSTKRFFDSPNGHSMLSEEILSHLDDSTTVYVGVESTGGYENNWIALFANLAAQHRLYYSRINPRAICNSAKVLLTRTITDEVSAMIIADYLRRYRDEIDFSQSSNFRSLRRLWSSRELIQKGHSAIWQHLQQVLYDANPVILRYTRTELPQWVLQVLLKYPTAKKLAKAHAKTVAKIPYVSIGRAMEMIGEAQRSIASDNEECTAFLIQESVRNLLDTQKRVKSIDSLLIKEMVKYPEMELLTSIPGIGEITAVGLLMNIGDINRFPNVKKLSSYFGLHPMFKESGDGKTVSRMSKIGKKRPRAMLYMAVMGGLRTNEILRSIHAEAKAAGMPPQASIGKCMHKLLRLVYGVLKSGKKFNVEIHNKHKLKGDLKRVAKKEQAQEPEFVELFAPVSAREAKRIRDRATESQKGKDLLVRDQQRST